MRVLPAPAGRILQDLDGLDDRELLGIVGSLRRSSERRAAAYELLVGRYRNMVWSCVQWYRRGPEPTEDPRQVGYAGLLKAINNFDPAFGGSLTASARPCDAGEIKRHFRDKRWQVHVGRSVQELILQVREATWQLTQQLGHIATDAVLAGHLGVSDADIRDARRTWGPVWRQYCGPWDRGWLAGHPTTPTLTPQTEQRILADRSQPSCLLGGGRLPMPGSTGPGCQPHLAICPRSCPVSVPGLLCRTGRRSCRAAIRSGDRHPPAASPRAPAVR
jgi:hypothetical protein